ncbi:MAG: acetate/propionate family kinase [Chlorobiaceae bacterium]|nr:acetate/propionate family kinase [Chlorobiaceae bacterium]
MKPTKKILALNTGSSSIKFSLYEIGAEEKLLLTGSHDRIGRDGGRFAVRNGSGGVLADESASHEDHENACEHVFSWLLSQKAEKPDAVGHRIVHGGPAYSAPVILSPEILLSLGELSLYAPEHLPPALGAVRHVWEVLPGTPQVACFDTSFHSVMPSFARFYPLPEEVRTQGVLRYGFHGLSYEYLMSELERQAGREAAMGKVILAHLGHGASMAAVKEGKSIDTSMGFSPAGGLVMSTRTGDLDPGVILFLLLRDRMSPGEIKEMVNLRSGLLGISGISDDMQVLLAKASENLKAREAVEMFCYRAKQCVGSYAAAMGGIDTIVFSGGIGANSPEIRARICEGLDFLGITIDPGRNRVSAPMISEGGAGVTVRVMETNEEIVIVRHTLKKLEEREGFS